MNNNAYGLMKEMLAIDSEIQKLTDELKSASNDTLRSSLERQIDSLYADFLKHKHRLELIKVEN